MEDDPLAESPMLLSETFVSMRENDPEKDLKVVFRDLCAEFGFSNMTYFAPETSMPDANQDLLFTTYSEGWIAHYFEREYENVDPVLTVASRSLLPVDWSDLAADEKHVKEFFGEAREFGVGKRGLTIPVRGVYGEQILFSINANLKKNKWQGFRTVIKSDVTYLAFLIHQEVLTNVIGIESKGTPRLTPRETQALQWAARGKTAWETASILGLKERTVEFYLRNACSKLRVVTKAQAVAKAVQRRLVLM